MNTTVTENRYEASSPNQDSDEASADGRGEELRQRHSQLVGRCVILLILLGVIVLTFGLDGSKLQVTPAEQEFNDMMRRMAGPPDWLERESEHTSHIGLP